MIEMSRGAFRTYVMMMTYSFPPEMFCTLRRSELAKRLDTDPSTITRHQNESKKANLARHRKRKSAAGAWHTSGTCIRPSLW
jgi:DNA-binding MarR family transcriptional regulator